MTDRINYATIVYNLFSVEISMFNKVIFNKFLFQYEH